jgi:hypothetical protein
MSLSQTTKSLPTFQVNGFETLPPSSVSLRPPSSFGLIAMYTWSKRMSPVSKSTLRPSVWLVLRGSESPDASRKPTPSQSLIFFLALKRAR